MSSSLQSMALRSMSIAATRSLRFARRSSPIRCLQSDVSVAASPMFSGPRWNNRGDSLHCRNAVVQSHRSFSSSTGSSFFSSPLEWWRKRQENHELEKYKKRIIEMAEKDKWMIGDAVLELEESVNSWKAKIPGASSTSEIKQAKQMLKNLHGIVKVVGKDATHDHLLQMSHKDKLLAALNGETTLDEINMLIEQFGMMTMMHKAIRKRKLAGKTIPSSPEGVSALVKAEAPQLMSKEQKAKLGKEQAKRLLKRNR